MGFLGRLVVLVVAALMVSSAPALAAGTLKVSLDGRGKVDSVSDGKPDGVIHCDSADPRESVCQRDFCVTKCTDVTLTLRPVAADGFAFREWTGRPACARDKQGLCPVTVGPKLDADLTAVFADIAHPDVTLSQLPPAARGALSLVANADDNVDISSVSFTVNGVGVPATEGPAGWTAIATPAEGVAGISATATDSSGNTTTTAVATVLIDNSPPAVTLTGPDGTAFPPGATESWTIAATDATGIRSLRCSVVPAGAAPAFGACTAADRHDVSGLAQGTYTFSVEAADKIGNPPGVTSRTFSIDATPPVTAIVAGIGDGASTSATSLSWDFVASEPAAAFACRVYPAALTPGAFAPCSSESSHTASGFSPGTYTFEVRATDLVGNVEPMPAKRTFTVVAPPADAAPAPPPAPASASAPAAATVLAASSGRPSMILVTLAFSYANSTRKETKLTSLVVRNVPAGATVTASCPRSCAKKSFKRTNASRKVSLAPLLTKPLKAGTVITVVVSKPGLTSAVKTLKIQPRKSPTVKTQCQPEGASKPSAC